MSCSQGDSTNLPKEILTDLIGKAQLVLFDPPGNILRGRGSDGSSDLLERDRLSLRETLLMAETAVHSHHTKQSYYLFRLVSIVAALPTGCIFLELHTDMHFAKIQREFIYYDKDMQRSYVNFWNCIPICILQISLSCRFFCVIHGRRLSFGFPISVVQLTRKRNRLRLTNVNVGSMPLNAQKILRIPEVLIVHFFAQMVCKVFFRETTIQGSRQGEV